MVAAVLEREVKYDVPPGASLPSLTGLPGVDRAEIAPPQVLFATYYDTASFALARAGITLRRRTGGTDAGWHLKLPKGDARLELQLPDAAGGPPRELYEAVRDLLGGEPLAAIAHIRTNRLVVRLLDRNGELLAEVCDDHVAAARSGRPRVLTWREWELELKAGDAALLAAAAGPFAQAGARPARFGSKLLRTLRLRTVRRL